MEKLEKILASKRYGNFFISIFLGTLISPLFFCGYEVPVAYYPLTNFSMFVQKPSRFDSISAARIFLTDETGSKTELSHFWYYMFYCRMKYRVGPKNQEELRNELRRLADFFGTYWGVKIKAASVQIEDFDGAASPPVPTGSVYVSVQL